jgi:hypothetical protein
VLAGVPADGTLIDTLCWGPRAPGGERVARAGSAAPPAPAAGAAAGTGVKAGSTAGPPPVPARTGGGFGLLGALGIVATLASAGVIVWTLRK